MKVVVTGGSGFIGEWVRKELLDQGHIPYVFDRSAPRPGDVRLVQHVVSGFKGMDACIHLAGVLGTQELFKDPYNAIRVNIQGTVNVLMACRQHGMQYVAITMPNVWKNLYQMTKRASMEAAEIWHDAFDVPISFVRAYNVYGPGQKLHGVKKIIPTFADHAWRGEPIPIWGDGTQTVDLVWVGDVARLLVNALKFRNGEVLEAGTGVPMNVNQVAQIVLSHTKSKAGCQYLPMREGEQPALWSKLCADVGLTSNLVGWCPVYKPEELALTIDWYKNASS